MNRVVKFGLVSVAATIPTTATMLLRSGRIPVDQPNAIAFVTVILLVTLTTAVAYAIVIFLLFVIGAWIFKVSMKDLWRMYNA